MTHLALYWHAAEGGRVKCVLCPHGCLAAEGKSGLCGARRVENGRLVAAGYGLISSVGLDPMEKKPLYHFHPGSTVFSIGGWGCNLACLFCQNWTISQRVEVDGVRAAPDEVVARADAFRRAYSADARRCVGIAYTYNEPLINIEFVRDCASLAREKGLVNVLVTNGYVQPEPAGELLKHIDALNIDIKSIDGSFYRKHCRGSVEPVQAFARQSVAAGCHVEITNLVIPGLNDSDEVFAELAAWIRDNLGEHVPLHISAYRPEYKLSIPPTPLETLVRAYRTCAKVLRYVYLGNVVSETGRDTNCPGCGRTLISRWGYEVNVRGISQGKCAGCGRKADIVGVCRRANGVTLG